MEINTYLYFRQFHLIPSLRVLFPNGENHDILNNSIWYSQDRSTSQSASIRDANFIYVNLQFVSKFLDRLNVKCLLMTLHTRSVNEHLNKSAKYSSLCRGSFILR